MASLKVVSDRLDDNSLKVAVVIPPRRNGEPNFGALERAIYGLHVLNPDAFDPHEPPENSVPYTLSDGRTVRIPTAGPLLAEQQFDTATSGPALNHAGGDIAE